MSRNNFIICENINLHFYVKHYNTRGVLLLVVKKVAWYDLQIDVGSKKLLF